MMTEFQGWLMLAMLAFVVSAIHDHAGAQADKPAATFLIIAIILAGVGVGVGLAGSID